MTQRIFDVENDGKNTAFLRNTNFNLTTFRKEKIND